MATLAAQSGTAGLRHIRVAIAPVTLAAIHILAALKYQRVDRNGLIGRMNPF